MDTFQTLTKRNISEHETANDSFQYYAMWAIATIFTPIRKCTEKNKDRYRGVRLL